MDQSREKDKQKHQTCANGAQKRKPDCLEQGDPVQKVEVMS